MIISRTLTLEDGQPSKPAPEGIEVKIYMTDPDALTDLALGDGTRFDAVLTALPTAEKAIKGGQPLKISAIQSSTRIRPGVRSEESARLQRAWPTRSPRSSTICTRMAR